MGKISSGIRDLDGLLDQLYIGDNVIWEVEAGTSSESFVKNFIDQSASEGKNIIYVSFNRSPQSILQKIGHVSSDGFVLLDCFTSGKGKNDKAFTKYYEKDPAVFVRKVAHPADIDEFSSILNSIEDSLPSDTRYVFDSLTGMQDLWGDEQSTYKFFTYMCPRLYDLDTVAYWLLEKDAHSQTFKANLRHITQVVLDLYKRKDHLYIKALKLDGRNSREAFRPHSYTIDESNISIASTKRDSIPDIGTKIKETRTALRMSQKELAEKVDLSPSFISQLESNQISPSLNSFIQICNALGMNPGRIWEDAKAKDTSWLRRKDLVMSSPPSRKNNLSFFNIFQNGTSSGSLLVMEPNTAVEKHLTAHRGKELIYVLHGTVSVTVEGRQETLHSGDSIFLDKEQPSVWSNKGGDEAQLLVICI